MRFHPRRACGRGLAAGPILGLLVASAPTLGAPPPPPPPPPTATTDATPSAIPDSAWRPRTKRPRRGSPSKATHLMRSASVLLPLGAVFAMVGGIAMAVAEKEVDDIASVPPGTSFPRDRYREARANHIAGIVLLSAGCTMMVASAVAFGLSRYYRHQERRRRRVSVTPWVGRGAGLTVRGQF